MSSSAAISQSELFGTYPSAGRLSPATLGLVVALHAAALGALALRQVASPLPAAPALMVQVLPAEAPPPTSAPATPSRPTSKPAPTRQAMPQALPQLAARSTAPAASEAAPSESPRPAPAAAVPVVPAVSQPRFDADYLLNPAPTYPGLSRRLGEEGRVLLRVFVEPNGRPSQIEVKSGSGSARLDQAAEEAVWRWKFLPARRADEAVGAWVQVPVVFNLRG